MGRGTTPTPPAKGRWSQIEEEACGGFEVREPRPSTPATCGYRPATQCAGAVNSARGWRSLEGPPHRVVRRDTDNGTGVTINQKICGKLFTQFFLTVKNMKKATFSKIVSLRVLFKSRSSFSHYYVHKSQANRSSMLVFAIILLEFVKTLNILCVCVVCLISVKNIWPPQGTGEFACTHESVKWRLCVLIVPYT